MTNISAAREPVVWDGIVFEWPDPAQQQQLTTPDPLVLEAEESCQAGDVAKTLTLLDRFLKEKKSLVDLYPLFLRACRTGRAALVRALLEHDFKPSTLAAEEAIGGRQVEILALLRDAGWDPLGRLEEPVPGPLYLAVATKDADPAVVQWFLNEGAEPDRRCLVDKTALSYAVGLAPLSIIKLLIEHVPNRHPQHGELLHAVASRPENMHDHADVVKLLLGCTSFKVNGLIHRDDVYSRAMIAYTGAGTPLHFAALNDNPQAAAALIDVGASSTILDDKGDSPIDIAFRHNHQAVLAVLLAASAQRGE